MGLPSDSSNHNAAAASLDLRFLTKCIPIAFLKDFPQLSKHNLFFRFDFEFLREKACIFKDTLKINDFLWPMNKIEFHTLQNWCLVQFNFMKKVFLFQNKISKLKIVQDFFTKEKKRPFFIGFKTKWKVCLKTVFFELYLILNSWVAGFTNHLTLGVCNFSHVTGDFNAISCMIISFMNISRPKYIFTPFILIFSGYLNTFGFKADNCHFSCDNFSSL